MDDQTREIPAGTLDKFHMGVSADGRSCMMTFVDDGHRTIKCVAEFAEFNVFIANLNRVADEMQRRRSVFSDEEAPASGALNLAFGEFRLSPTDSYIEGALVADSGQIIGIRMCPEVAYQLSKAILMTAPAASSC